MFSTTMFQMGNNTAIEVPADVVAAFGAGKRPPVVVRVNDRVPVDRRPMGGMYLLPFSAERRGIRHPGRRCHRRQVDAGYRARAVEVPEDLQAALDASPSAAAAWDKSYSNRKSHVTSVLGAKAAETRARRVAAVVTKLEG